MRYVRQFLEHLRGLFPRARIIAKEGNHEERFTRYMLVRAPEVFGMAQFTLEKLFKFDELQIEYVREKRPIQLGKLNIIHGHEFKWAIANPVNPARGFFLKAKTHCLGGHLHQSSQHSEKNLDGTVISTWSTGALCDLHPDYSPINSWSHGFAFVETDKRGAFEVTNKRIINGKVY